MKAAVPAVFLTVTLNPTLDLSTTVPRLIDHQKLRCSPHQEQVGGGGINVAQVLQSLGGVCQACFPAGGWLGHEIVTRLNGDGLDCLSTPVEQPSRQCFTVYESQTGHEYRFILPGPTLDQPEWHRVIETILEHVPRDYLIMSGSLPPGVPDDFYAQVTRRVKLKHPTLKVVVDASGAALAQALEAGLFMIKPSEQEFAELTGLGTEDESRCLATCRALIARERVQVIALSLGAKGAWIVTNDEALRVAPLPVKVTSTVGAGDSFVGGFLWSLSQGGTLREAAAIATAAAGAALQTQGKLRFDRATILEQAQRVVIEPLDACP